MIRHIKGPRRIHNTYEDGFKLKPNPKNVKLVVLKGNSDVYIAFRKNGKRFVTVLVTI